MGTVWQNRNFRENTVVLALFFAAVHLAYGRTVEAGFVTDFTGLMERLDGAPFRGVLHCFGFPAMHQVTNFFLYLFVHGFGVQAWPWYLVYTSLHVANAYLGYLLAKKIFGQSGEARPILPALAASLLFLLSPYQADAVVWKVCFNFLFCTLCLLGALLLLLKQVEGPRGWPLFFSHGLFVVALFSFELSLALPLLSAPLFFYLRNGSQGSSRPFYAKKVLLPQVLLVAGYFLLNKYLLGAWVGHYGEATHLNFDLRPIASNSLKYFTKYLLYWREWPHGAKEKLQVWLEQPTVAYAGLAIGGLALLAGLFFFRKMPARLRAAGLGWLLFFAALLPVANLYVAWILKGENDRYGYLPSLFFFIGLVACGQMLPRLLRYPLFAGLLAMSVFSLHQMAVNWQQGARIVNSLLDGFRWEAAPEVYVLASPENYNGIPMFKDFSRQNLAVKHALRYVGGKRPEGEFFQVAQFNMATPTDGLTVTAADSAGVFRAQFNQWGNWWWLHGIGTGDYETDRYRFVTDGNGCRVELLRSAVPGAVFIYPVGGEWKTVDGPPPAH